MVDDHAIDNGRGIWGELSEGEVWQRYVEMLSAAARSGHFDVLSHPDLAKIYGVRGSDERYRRAGGGRRRVGRRPRDLDRGSAQTGRRALSDARLLAMSSAPVTFASDAHEPVLVGEDFEGAVAFARANGRDTVERLRRACAGDRSRSGERATAWAPGSTRTRSRRACRSCSAACDRPSARARRPLRRRRARARAHRRGARRGRAGGHRRALPVRRSGARRRGLGRAAARRRGGTSEDAGWELANADVVLIGEEPRLAPHRDAMRARLADALGVDPERVAVRATTTDGLGFTGRGEGLAAQAVALLQPMKLRIVTHAEHHDLRGKLPDLWPEFMDHDPIVSTFWPRLYEVYADFQLWVLDGRTTVAIRVHAARGVGRAGRAARPRLGHDERRGGRRRRCARSSCARARRIAAHGLARCAARRHEQLAAAHGLDSLIAPVRPTWKEHYPLTPIERYVRWRREDGLPYDPWLRTHERIGGRFSMPAPRSMTITGSREEWEEWTGLQFPEDGDYIVPRRARAGALRERASARTSSRTCGCSTRSTRTESRAD